MQAFTCPKKCCTIRISPYQRTKNPYDRVRRRRRKAGVFIRDPDSGRVLLVQSRGHLWGAPKGTMNYGETERECAVREVKEETGLDVDQSQFTRTIKIRNRAIYFYMELSECSVTVQNHVPNNDANGIMWVKPDCLEELIKKGNVSISQHCRIIFSKFLGKYFPHSTFTMVGKKRCSSRFPS